MAEKARLGRFILKRLTRSEGLETLSAAERARMAFEELGPTFVKLGQLLATRPNLIPPDFADEFKKFHDKVAPVSYEEIKKVLAENFPEGVEKVFQSIDPNPIAAASIAQVHGAVLKSGQHVAIKVRRPGIIEIIKNDVGVLYQVAELLEKYVPESRIFNPINVVDEFFRTLELETNFAIEANNMRRIRTNFAGDASIKIPQVFSEISSEQVLVMERLHGISLTDTKALDGAGIDRKHIVEIGLRAFFKMVFRDGIFHGDLHAGNIFIIDQNTIGLVDFGVVGRLSPKIQTSIANMFVALFTEDYETLANEYLEVAPFSSHLNFDEFSRELRELLSPYYGMTFKNVQLGAILMDSTAIAAKYQIVMPADLMLYFKAIFTVEGMGRNIINDFDILAYSLNFAQDILKAKYDPQRIIKDLVALGQDVSHLVYGLPRQLRHLLRRLNSNDFAIELEVRQLDEVKRAIETQGSLTYLGLVVASLVISSTMALSVNVGPQFYGIPAISITGYCLALLTGIVAFWSYVKG